MSDNVESAEFTYMFQEFVQPRPLHNVHLIVSELVHSNVNVDSECSSSKDVILEGGLCVFGLDVILRESMDDGVINIQDKIHFGEFGSHFEERLEVSSLARKEASLDGVNN
jgi:hypothetical protein